MAARQQRGMVVWSWRLDLGGNWGNEFARLAAARKLSTEQLWDLYPPYPGEKPASAVDLAKLYRDLGVYKNDAGLKTSFSLPIIGEPGFNEGRGSNNWVVAGSHTTTGKPLLANDPHLALSAPAIWYYAHLKTPNTDVMGASLPGLPFVVLGRNAHVAWGFTNTGPDVQDLYLEQIDAANLRATKRPQAGKRLTLAARPSRSKASLMSRMWCAARAMAPSSAMHKPCMREVLDMSRFVLGFALDRALDADNRTLVGGLKAQKAQKRGRLAKSLWRQPFAHTEHRHGRHPRQHCLQSGGPCAGAQR